MEQPFDIISAGSSSSLTFSTSALTQFYNFKYNREQIVTALGIINLSLKMFIEANYTKKLLFVLCSLRFWCVLIITSDQAGFDQE
jgi:hypothetical protein